MFALASRGEGGDIGGNLRMLIAVGTLSAREVQTPISSSTAPRGPPSPLGKAEDYCELL